MKIKFKHIYVIFSVVAVCFFGYVIVKKAYPAVKYLDIFKLERVTLKGLKYLDPESVVKLSGLKYGDSLVFVDEERVIKKLETHPRIEVTRFQKKYPAEVIIEIKEEHGPFILIGKGQVVEMSYDKKLADKSGIYEWDQVYLKATEIKDKNMISNFVSAVKNLPKEEQDFRNLISEVVFTDEAVLYMRVPGIKIVLGFRITTEKLRLARYAFLYCRQKKLPLEQIDLRMRHVKLKLRSSG